MLREHGVEAWLFDADFVRQDWFKMIAYGGYRIVVRDESVSEATEVLHGYRNGEFAVAEELRAICPNCSHASSRDDPQPRRNVFLAMIFLGFFGPFVMVFWKPSAMALFAACVLLIAAYITLPWIVIRYFKWRARCEACGHHWHQPPQLRYREMVRMAETAEHEET